MILRPYCTSVGTTFTFAVRFSGFSLFFSEFPFLYVCLSGFLSLSSVCVYLSVSGLLPLSLSSVCVSICLSLASFLSLSPLSVCLSVCLWPPPSLPLLCLCVYLSVSGLLPFSLSPLYMCLSVCLWPPTFLSVCVCRSCELYVTELSTAYIAFRSLDVGSVRGMRCACPAQPCLEVALIFHSSEQPITFNQKSHDRSDYTK